MGGGVCGVCGVCGVWGVWGGVGCVCVWGVVDHLLMRLQCSVRCLINTVIDGLFLNRISSETMINVTLSTIVQFCVDLIWIHSVSLCSSNIHVVEVCVDSFCVCRSVKLVHYKTVITLSCV